MAKYNPDSYWWYVPISGPPILFCVLFFFSGVLHAYQTWRYKSWRFTAMMPWSAAIMVAGFAMRELAHYRYDDLGIMIASQVLVLSGPPAYAVTDYLVFSRILFYIPYLAPMHPGRVITTFLGLDVVIEILIGQGVWRMINSTLKPKERNIGAALVKAALILQALCFIAFVALAVAFHIRAKRMGVLSQKIKSCLRVLYASAAIITARCIYRIVEFFMGWNSAIYHSEIYFYIFEAALMFVNTLILNVWHPGQFLPPNNHVFLSKDGKTEVRGPGWEDDRAFIFTLFDPFDLAGLIAGNDSKNKFWDMSPEELEAHCDAVQAKRDKKWYNRLRKRNQARKALAAKQERSSAPIAQKNGSTV